MATTGPVSNSDQWLTLEQAARRLGIHATTLRRWADEGAIDVFLTPGGHRRFLLSDMERFHQEHHHSRAAALDQDQWGDHAIAHTRQEIPNQGWVAAYGETDRETQRGLGRRLIVLTLQYIALPGEDPTLQSEARAIGREHARCGKLRAQSLADLLQAVSFFRTVLLEVALVESPHAGPDRAESTTRVLRRIERLVGEVQAGVVELYTNEVVS